MWLPILFLLFLVVFTTALVVILVRSCTLPRRVAKGPCCGQCGYSFTGWSICPECGSAVTDVGVETPRIALRYRGSVALAACALAVLTLVSGLVAWGIGLATFDQLGYEYRRGSATLVPVTRSNPQANYFAYVTVEAEIGPNGKIRTGESILALEIVPPTQAGPTWINAQKAIAHGSPHIRLNLADQTYAISPTSAAAATSGGQLDATTVKSFLRASGVSAVDQELDTAADELSRVIRSGRSDMHNWSMRQGDPTLQPFTVQNDFSSMEPASPVLLPGLSSFASWSLLVALSLLTLFALALRFIVRRRRRLLGAHGGSLAAGLKPPAPAAPHAHS